MKIVQVGPYPLALDCIRGGVESSVYGLTTELARMGENILVLDNPRTSMNDARVAISDYLTVYRYKNPGNRNLDMLKRVEDMVADIVAANPDVVHVHGTSELSAAIYRVCKKQGLKVMLTIHGLVRVEKRNMIGKAWKKHEWKRLTKLVLQYVRQNRVECSLLGYADKAIVDTSYLVDALKEYPVKNLPKLYVIPQGANERFYNGERLSVNGDRTILCVGTFSQRKSQTELIRAFEMVRAKGIETKLVLCGVVSEELYYRKVKAAIDASPYKNDIVLKENLSQKELLNEYQKATVFALHSQEESQGIVLAEAMAMGLPVVSNKVGGIPYVVEDSVTGLLTEYGDVEGTAKALEKILEDEVMRGMMSVAARKAAEKYRWQSIAKEVMKCYESKERLRYV